MKDSMIDSIKSLPALSKTILDINKVYANEDSSIFDLIKVIESDPMIVANLLKVASSPLYSFKKEIRNISQAVSLFGMGLTRSIAIGNSVKKLLNIDMQPYGVSSDGFAEISSLQATLMLNWYRNIDKTKADKLYLASFLQETGKIIIASEIIQEDETISFASEIEMSNNIALVEKSYVGATSSEVTAKIFEHWNFEDDFIEMIRYADNPKNAPDEIKEYSTALHIVKTAIPLNKPFNEQSHKFALKIAENFGYDISLLQEAINHIDEHKKG